MNKHLTRKLAAVAVLAAGLGGISASGLTAASASSSTSFTYWTSGWSTSQIATIDAAFAKAYPGETASGQYIASSDEYLPKVIAALKSGTQPTVLTDQSPSDLPLVAESGKLIDLNGKLTAQTNALYPGIKSSLFYRGKQLGMAFSGEGDLVLFYNKADFAAAGISSPPQTWTQLETDAAKLTDPAKKRWGFYVPFGDAEWISFAFEPLLWADGGSLLNSSQTKAAFDSPAGVKALTTWVDFVRTDKVAPDESFAEAGNFDGDPAFESNTVAMFISGQWEISAFTKDKLDYGVAEFPAGTVGRSTNIGIGVMALLQTTPAEDAAGLNFMKFLSTPAEAAYLTEQSGGLPDSADVLSQPSMKSFIASSPSYNVFAANEQYGQVRPITPAYNAVSQALYTEINAALHGSVTPSQALAIAAKNADTALASNNS